MLRMHTKLKESAIAAADTAAQAGLIKIGVKVEIKQIFLTDMSPDAYHIMICLKGRRLKLKCIISLSPVL